MTTTKIDYKTDLKQKFPPYLNKKEFSKKYNYNPDTGCNDSVIFLKHEIPKDDYVPFRMACLDYFRRELCLGYQIGDGVIILTDEEI